jgi:hypothetical protein
MLYRDAIRGFDGSVYTYALETGLFTAVVFEGHARPHFSWATALVVLVPLLFTLHKTPSLSLNSHTQTPPSTQEAVCLVPLWSWVFPTRDGTGTVEAGV